jgi:hypothetical protein
MIKFFRHIRKSLLMENKTSKYFKYAVGEIVLVVLGILIALQINNWNEVRLNKKKEINYVNRLIEDLVSDTLMISEQISASNKRFEGGMLVDSLLEINDLKDNNPVDVIFIAQGIGRMWLPQYNSNTYDDLIGTGNFSLMTDPILADKVRIHYTSLPYSWNDTFDQRNEELRRVMVELIPLKFHVAVLVPQSMPEIQELETILSSVEAKQIFENMISYPKMEFYVKNVTRGHIFHIGLMEDIKKGTIDLIHDLQSFKN